MSSPAYETDPRLVAFEQNFYYPQEDFLAEMQKGQKWTWNVIRPEAIIGMYADPELSIECLLTKAINKATLPSRTA